MSNRLELYKKTTDKLFNAYFSDKLLHGVCHACAVGNILGGEEWGILFLTSEGKQKVADEGEALPFKLWMRPLLSMTPLPVENYTGSERKAVEIILEKGKRLIEQSGYTKEELMKVELSFESADQGTSREDYMFNGLVAVLGTLKKIHEISDDSEEVERFTSEHNRKLELA